MKSNDEKTETEKQNDSFCSVVADCDNIYIRTAMRKFFDTCKNNNQDEKQEIEKRQSEWKNK